MRVRDLWAMADALLVADGIVQTMDDQGHGFRCDDRVRVNVEQSLTVIEDALFDAYKPWVSPDRWQEIEEYCHKATQIERLQFLRAIEVER